MEHFRFHNSGDVFSDGGISIEGGISSLNNFTTYQ